jgi:predicted permease
MVVSPGSVSPPDFTDWRTLSKSFAEMAALTGGGYALTGEGNAERVPGTEVTGGFFQVLGSPALVGRTLQHADDEGGGAAVAVLSHALWQRRFGADRNIIGRSVSIDDVSREIVGIMPPEFDFPFGSEVWVPLTFSAHELATQRGAHYLTVIGRLRPNLALAQAQAELNIVGKTLATRYPTAGSESRIAAHDLRTALVGDVRPAMRFLFVAVALLLLVACVNVASLVLGAALGRGRDYGVRAALGAGRGRLVRSQLAESLVLAAGGGTLGLLLAAFGIRAIRAIEGADIPLLDQTRLDPSVLFFAAAATIVSAMLFGAVPAWRASRGDLATVLRGETGRSTLDQGGARARSLLVMAEVGLAVALVVGAGLVGRSFASLLAVPLGFESAGVHTASISWPEASYPPARRAQFLQDLRARLDARPEVASSGAIFGLPLAGINYYISGHTRDGVGLSPEDANLLTVQIRIATPDYFQTMGIQLQRGRAFEDGDRTGRAPVIVVNETAARMLWPDMDPVGRSFTVGTRLGLGGERAGGEVIGVVADVRDNGPAARVRPSVYLAHAQFPMDSVIVVLKARTAGLALGEFVREETRALDSNLPVFRVRSMDQWKASVVAQPRLYLGLLGLFALVAVTLAAIGVYGVMAQTVNGRTREIGIRLALGADRWAVVRMVVGQAARLAVAGIIAGCVMAWSARALVAQLLFGVAATDAATYTGVALAVFLVAVLAAWLPARRASKLDPTLALRSE